MNKIKNTKGFTLMEMLIVVAIIAVLVAIAIPTFTTSLNDARVATDKANIRSGYASMMADVLTTQFNAEENGKPATVTYKLNKDGSVTQITTGTTAAANAYLTIGHNTKTDNEIAGIKINETGAGWEKDKGVTYTYTFADGTVKIEVK